MRAKGASRSKRFEPRLLLRADGVSIIEVVIVAAIISLMLAAAISRMNPNYRAAEASASELLANLRLCRTKAVSSGYHYQLSVTGASTYTVNRLLPPTSGTDWTVDGGTPTLTYNLLPNVRFTASTGRYEFNTRGTIVVRTNETFVPLKTLNNTSLNNSAFVQIWTSGQMR
jgi:type II secretory pathway pseudopilin PulG